MSKLTNLADEVIEANKFFESDPAYRLAKAVKIYHKALEKIKQSSHGIYCDQHSNEIASEALQQGKELCE